MSNEDNKNTENILYAIIGLVTFLVFVGYMAFDSNRRDKLHQQRMDRLYQQQQESENFSREMHRKREEKARESTRRVEEAYLEMLTRPIN